MTPGAERKRRASVRYIIGGQVMFHSGSPDSYGGLVNIGRHGMLVRTHVQVPQGTEFRIGFTVAGYPALLQGDGQVVGFSQDLLAVRFLREPAGMVQLLEWLSQEHVPWTGLDTLHTNEAVVSLVSAQAEPKSSGAQKERQELEAILPFIEAMG